MRVFEELEPKDVFYYFEEICNIPHGSGNIEGISNYLVQFAKDRKLTYYQDEALNVIIIKEASEGYEDHEPVMLQGHMDMVAVKRPDCDIDMKKEGLRIRTEEDRIYAEGTSLGGDDGIAVAYGLALLAGDYKHPRIELVVTVDEEVGMDGARVIDLTPCRAHTLINLDSEEEGYFLSGCAGGARVNYSFAYEQEKLKGIPCMVKVSGLLGGHSGAEIHKERGNADHILFRALTRLKRELPFGIVSMEGGVADNAIPGEAQAQLIFTGEEPEKSKALARELIAGMEKDLKTELKEKDPGVSLKISFEHSDMKNAMKEETTARVLAFLNVIPYGVQAMSGAMEGLVETSLNLGILTCREGHLHAGISVRSSIESAKYALIDRLKSIAELAGVETEVTGDYPGWAYRRDSRLREKMTEVYERMYGKKPVIQAIHAGLECGLLAGKIEDLDCVSIGPDMKNIHTAEEELSISSTKRVWEFLIALLEEM